MSGGPTSDPTKANKDLSLLAPLFRKAVEAAIAECNSATPPLEAMVFEGYRTQEMQRIYYARGRTVVPPLKTVTNAKSNLDSWHGYGLAVDVIHRTKLWNPDGGDTWFEKVAAIFKKHGCNWGGDWTTRDTPHMQWGRCKPSPSDRARELIASGGAEAVWRAVGAMDDIAISPPQVATPPMMVGPYPLAWGARVSLEFRVKTVKICNALGISDPSWLMTCMAFETGETFSPKIPNAAGSGAVGLIQFMPSTAIGLGTTTKELAAMTAVDQLDYVQRYFQPYQKKLKNLNDLYLAILWPRGVGRPDAYVVFDRAVNLKAYTQNRGLDVDNDGKVTRGEICCKIQKKHEIGLRDENVSPIP